MRSRMCSCAAAAALLACLLVLARPAAAQQVGCRRCRATAASFPPLHSAPCISGGTACCAAGCCAGCMPSPAAPKPLTVALRPPCTPCLQARSRQSGNDAPFVADAAQVADLEASGAVTNSDVQCAPAQRVGGEGASVSLGPERTAPSAGTNRRMALHRCSCSSDHTPAPPACRLPDSGGRQGGGACSRRCAALRCAASAGGGMRRWAGSCLPGSRLSARISHHFLK